MTNIYVGNLPREMDEDELRNLFSEFGQVDRVSIIMDRESGRSRGFGFVEMSDGAQAAIDALNGKEFAGRALTVNISQPKERSESGGGGGRSRSRR